MKAEFRTYEADLDGVPAIAFHVRDFEEERYVGLVLDLTTLRRLKATIDEAEKNLLSRLAPSDPTTGPARPRPIAPRRRWK